MSPMQARQQQQAQAGQQQYQQTEQAHAQKQQGGQGSLAQSPLFGRQQQAQGGYQQGTFDGGGSVAGADMFAGGMPATGMVSPAEAQMRLRMDEMERLIIDLVASMKMQTLPVSAGPVQSTPKEHVQGSPAPGFFRFKSGGREKAQRPWQSKRDKERSAQRAQYKASRKAK